MVDLFVDSKDKKKKINEVRVLIFSQSECCKYSRSTKKQDKPGPRKTTPGTNLATIIKHRG